VSCLVDTSCLVALICSTHQHHERTLRELEARAKKSEPLLLAEHSIAEAWAVLTRLPPPMRLSPALAEEALRADWKESEAISLTASETWSVLRELSERGFSGGRIYDALIAACAQKAGVDTLLTWNLRHIVDFADGFEVRTPR
jgi:predicted nucleic acid-binding protein